ncbi:MAG TPA: aminotransferase class I/II-fold pyridoxal phosphate-dependent enzyme [Bacteroidetes bacterium]|nr:aminotransferase class I/II-fold pyridoxal phosphate-dependent enzyme [Bacteroidota bacterium]
MIIDLRSDTVTKPSTAMKEAMMNAKLGDDVFEDDPSVNELQEKAADMFGMEAAIFCPSGTMTNQIAIKLHTQPGDELICHRHSHIYNYEGGGIAFNSGVSVRLVEGDLGRISAEQILKNINPDDVHCPITSLVSIENTVNRAGGICYSLDEVKTLSQVCSDNKIALHMDGARLFNAIVETNTSAKDYGQILDSVSICMSKGLGCPVGSLLIGKKDFIKRARRIRKGFGGGMRQAGIIAAAAHYALDNNIDRLKEDHLNARTIYNCLSGLSYIGKTEPCQTNIVIFELADPLQESSFMKHLEINNVKCAFIGTGRIRFVTHMDISAIMIDKIQEILTRFNG